MASAQNMEEHITCAVCFEIYRDPHALKCLHTFCLECINLIQRQHTITCPECRENTPLSSIKSDFKTSGFIDVYQQEMLKEAERKKKERKVSRQKSLRVSKPLVVGQDNRKCEMCQVSERPIKSKCIDCNQVMCESCSLTHRGFAVCQNHRVLPLKDAATHAVSNLKATLKQLKHDKEDVARRAGHITSQIDQIRRSHEQQIEEVNQITEELISELKQHRKHLNHTIFVANNGLVEKLHKNKQALINADTEMDENIEFITELVTSEDVATLNESAITVDANVKYDVMRLKESLPKTDQTYESPVQISKASKITPHDMIKVIIDGKHQASRTTDRKPAQITASSDHQVDTERGSHGFTRRASKEGLLSGTSNNTTHSTTAAVQNPYKPKVQQTGMPPNASYDSTSAHVTGQEHQSRQTGRHGDNSVKKDPLEGAVSNNSALSSNRLISPTSVKSKHPVNKQYAQVVNFSYRWERSCELAFHPQRICKIKTDVWIAGWDGVYVFNKNCQGVKTVKHSEIQMVRGLIYTHNGDIVLACGGHNGLVKIDKSGTYRGKLVSEGSFTDICTYKKKLYALETEEGKVLVFEHTPANGWTQVQQFNNFKKFERISVNNDSMYLSSREYCQVMVFNLDGHFLYETGKKGSRKAGRFNRPLLSDVNVSGDALVSDCDNHRLQIYYKSDSTWRILVLPGDLKWPVDAFIDDHANTVWLVKHEPCQLLKFTRKHASLGNLLDNSI